VGETYKKWNKYCKGLLNMELHTTITTITTQTTLTTQTTQTTQQLFDKLKKARINGRDLEICFPLIIISSIVGEIDRTLEDLIGIVKERKEEDNFESIDISLIDFIAQEMPVKHFVTIKGFTKNFKEHLQNSEEWINEKWMGRALKRLGLIREKRRSALGMEVILNYEKAEHKMEIFR
jgi:hypothetical protein